MAYLKLWVKDNAVWNISWWISASTTTISLASGNGALFPTWQVFVWTLVQYNTPADPTTWIAKQEKVLVTVRSTDTLTVTRWYDGSTATTFLSWDYFYLNVTSKIISDIQDEVTRLETDKLNLWALRTGLTNMWKMFFSNWSNAETELAFWITGTVLTSNWANASPSFEVPTVSITWLTEDTVWDMTADYLVKYDWTNKKILVNKYMASDAEALAWTSETKFINPKQVKDNYWFVVSAWTAVISSTSSVLKSHNTATYTKVREHTITWDWTYTVTFSMRSGQAWFSQYWRIYKI